MKGLYRSPIARGRFGCQIPPGPFAPERSVYYIWEIRPKRVGVTIEEPLKIRKIVYAGRANCKFLTQITILRHIPIGL